MLSVSAGVPAALTETEASTSCSLTRLSSCPHGPLYTGLLMIEHPPGASDENQRANQQSLKTKSQKSLLSSFVCHTNQLWISGRGDHTRVSLQGGGDPWVLSWKLPTKHTQT